MKYGKLNVLKEIKVTITGKRQNQVRNFYINKIKSNTDN